MLESPSISAVLQSFEAITLGEMDQVRLMNRIDRKFTFHNERLPDILKQVLPYYRVLEVSGARSSRYRSLYYDTPSYSLYHLHHSGKLNRYKLRHRQYVENDLGFFEVKFKNNKGRTIKSRVKVPFSSTTYPEQVNHFIAEKSPYSPEILKPAIWVNYRRITLVNRNIPERITIDTAIEFEDEQTQVKPRYLVIAEIKQDGNRTSPFLELLRKEKVREGSISKYCLGMALTHTDIKSNLFKPAIRAISSLI